MITVAATQMSCGRIDENIKKAESLIRIAAGRGAQIILLQELFQHSYFAIELSSTNFQVADPVEESPIVQGMAMLAKELQVVIPISFFERRKNSYYNSVAVIDADGTVLGVVRKSHITGASLVVNMRFWCVCVCVSHAWNCFVVMRADRLGYNEKYYFTPSEEPFKIWNTVRFVFCFVCFP